MSGRVAWALFAAAVSTIGGALLFQLTSGDWTHIGIGYLTGAVFGAAYFARDRDAS